MNVYVVLERRGDGYHTYEPELLAVYFDHNLAVDHSRRNEHFDVVSVPLAPQQLADEEADHG